MSGRQSSVSDSRASAPLLEARGLAVTVAGKPLLANIDMACQAGERVVLHGPSGAGKSSLLRVLAALDDPAAGQIRAAARTPAEQGFPEYRRQVLYVAQESMVYDETVAECLARPFRYRTSADQRYDHERARALLARLGLDDDILERRARLVSVGERQRISLIRALLLEPRVLLLDEPTSALDNDNTRAALALIAEQVEARGGCALLVSHDMAAVQTIATRALDIARWRVEPDEERP